MVHRHKCFYLPETADQFDFRQYDYVIDAIDTVTGKLEIIQQAKNAGVPVISAMGAGNKLDPTAFRVADIYETKMCPLARVMRNALRKRGIKSLKVVLSAGNGSEMYRSERYSGFDCVCSVCCRADRCRRSAERFGCTGGRIILFEMPLKRK